MGICLIGTQGSRRWEYFQKAAEACHEEVTCIDWKQVDRVDLSGQIVKIEPPSYATSNLLEMNEQVRNYREKLRMLAQTGAVFLNTPKSIETVLDKCLCKRILAQNDVAVTEVLSEGIDTVEALQAMMRERKASAVFIKPVYCSGAAGVVAYRRRPGREDGVAYTSCCVREGERINTKELYRLEKKEEIQRLLQAVLPLGVVVERWYPKDSCQGKSYDLRVVWQFGKICFVVARQSRGPITNLHLNNSPLSWEELGLPESVVTEIEELCGRAMACFPGLRVAGIDVLVERGTMKPRIIEINGQGDLMYQDIFHENKIYKQQIREMRKRWNQLI